METFDKLFTQYATEKGFVPDSRGGLYAKSLQKFMFFAAWYRENMTFESFKYFIID